MSNDRLVAATHYLCKTGVIPGLGQIRYAHAHAMGRGELMSERSRRMLHQFKIKVGGRV